jgi:hypothetical protein
MLDEFAQMKQQLKLGADEQAANVISQLIEDQMASH